MPSGKPNNPPKRPNRLGRGLSSLMAKPVAVDPDPAAPPPPTDAPPTTPVDAADPAENQAQTGDSDRLAVRYLAVSDISPNPAQPRQRFEEGALNRLAESIRSDGLMQPVVVRPREGATRFELVAGERRWRAAKLAGLASLPAVVQHLSDQQAAEWALIENLQREDLNPIERAEAFRSLADRHGLNHAEIGQRVGLDRSHISNLLRLLDLYPSVRGMVRDGLLSMGQARALLAVADSRAQEALAQRTVREGLSVRAVEAAARRIGAPERQARSSKSVTDNHLADLERQVGEQLGTRVAIRPGRKKGAGKLTIEFYSLDQFDSLLGQLGVRAD